MTEIKIKKAKDFSIPSIALGCMRINELAQSEADKLIKTSLELGINFFDHADIYGDGRCEEIFAKSIGTTSSVRDDIILQSKCAIRKGVAFDFSKEHILNSVDGILKRLNTDYIDILLLHRPDTLIEPEEVTEAFAKLQSSGKVKYFGVSNQNSSQIDLLQHYLNSAGIKLMFNQLQISIAHCPMIDAGFNVNMENKLSIDHDNGTLDYCRLNDITIQGWSPLQYGFFDGVFLKDDKFPELNKVLMELAKKYDVPESAIAIAWILRHPAKMQAIVGTTSVEHLIDMSKACDVELSREEWYALYMAAGKVLP